MKVPLSGRYAKGQFALIDDADAHLLVGRRVYLDTNGYGIVSIDGRNRTLQRHIMQPPSDSYLVDHINHDVLDCRRSNLRLATHSQSVHNRRRTIRNKSGYIGVFVHKPSLSGKYMARVTEGKKLYYLGLFHDPAEAARAYDKKVKELRGEFAYTNF
jgi:hypothetical protein